VYCISRLQEGKSLAEHFVRKDGGSNANDGHTYNTAWATINYASSHVSAGDTITVYSASTPYYEQVILSVTGTAGNIVTLRVYPGSTVIIDGTGVSNGGDDDGLIFLNSVSYVTVDGFTVRNAATSSGVVGRGEGHYNIIKNCIIHDTYWCGIFFLYSWNYMNNQGHVSYITIDNCETYNTNLAASGDEAVSLITVSHFEIKNCRVHDTVSIAIDLKNGSTIGSVHDCTVYDAGSGIYIDAREFVCDSVSFYNNICYNIGGSAGLIFGSESRGANTTLYMPAGVTNLLLYNNIVYDCNDGMYADDYSEDDPNITYDHPGDPNHGPDMVSFICINNTFYNNALGIVVRQTYDRYSNCAIRNNITATTGGDILISYDDYNDSTHTDPGGKVVIDHNLFYDSTNTYNTIYGTSYVKANPLFINAGLNNFNIQSGSPARDVGSSTSAIAFDIISTVRPQNSLYDIGAYEYITEEPPPPTSGLVVIITAGIRLGLRKR
jgi:hypothetical protein